MDKWSRAGESAGCQSLGEIVGFLAIDGLNSSMWGQERDCHLLRMRQCPLDSHTEQPLWKPQDQQKKTLRHLAVAPEGCDLSNRKQLCVCVELALNSPPQQSSEDLQWPSEA